MTTIMELLGTRQVRCVTCLTQFDWAGASLYRRGPNETWQEIDVPVQLDESMLAFVLDNSFIRCPNRIDGLWHHFPVEFAMHLDPVVIGFIGASSAGKTCLLAAMTGEIENGGLRPYGLHTEPANLIEHDTYLKKTVQPFYNNGDPPERTPQFNLVEYADAILLRATGSTRVFPLVFFDPSGETLEGLKDSHEALRFRNKVDGLIFVADPILAQGGDGETSGGTSFGARLGDPTYRAAMVGLRHARRAGETRFSMPATIAVTKSDLVRFEPPVDRWLNQPPTVDGVVDQQRVYRESRDAYAFLHQLGASSWLDPVDRFERCTLHFVSASGAAFDDASARFVRPARPRRVLEPLVALLAMIGVLDDQHVRGAIGY